MVSYDPQPASFTYAAYQPPAPPPVRAELPAGAGNYFVQLGSFADISNAQDLSNQVPQSLPVTIVPARVNGADFFRVRVGPVETRDDANRLRDQIAYSGVADGRVVAGD
ncbi:MAG: SPOR domain-containing protein [Hyphomonas sp.]